MKRILNVVFCAAATAAAIYAQPVIATGGIVNAASYAYSGLPNAGIAQGSLFLVFGSGLGPASLALASVPLSPTFGGTSLKVTVNGVSTQPLIAYTSAGQVEAVLPSNTPAGSGTLTVTYNGQTSATAPIQVVTSSFGIFAVNQAGSGPGIITNASYSIAGLSTAANPGHTYIIWGTGLGPIVSGSDANGGGTLGSISVQVLVGGSIAAVSGYARSSCCGGLDQIAFVVPTGVVGCHVPVAVQIGNVVSNFVSMPIATSGSVCSDPANPTVTPITGGGNVSIGNISLSRATISIPLPAPLGLTNSTIDTGSGSFYRYNPAQYAAQSNPLQIATFGSCTVFTFKGSNQTYVDPVQPVALDAGPAISVTGPNGTKTLTKTSGLYSAQLGGGIAGVPSQSPLYLSPGQYQINNGSGGADVGPFSMTLNVPAPLVWTNASSTTTVNRTAGQNVAWTGGDPAGNVEIVGYSTTGTGESLVGAEFVCIQQASAGSFTIPAPVLLSLPPSTTTAATGIPSGFLGVGYFVGQAFTATGLDQATVSASGFSLQTVTYQ